MKIIIFSIFISLLLTSCDISRLSPAPIIYKNPDNDTKKEELIEFDKKSSYIYDDDDDDEIISYKNNNEQNSRGSNQKLNNDTPTISEQKDIEYKIYHHVKKNETINDIIKQYNTTLEEIIILNDLDFPYDLEEFQIIQVKPNNKNLTSKNSIKHKKEPIDKTISFTEEKKEIKFIYPVIGDIRSYFGTRNKNGGINKGINIIAKQGTPVKSATNGKVFYTGVDSIFGNLVIIQVDNKNFFISYSHLESIIITKNSFIKQGDIIGYVGKTGDVTFPQLHFAIREGKIAKDPLLYLPKKN